MDLQCLLIRVMVQVSAPTSCPYNDIFLDEKCFIFLASREAMAVVI